MSHKVRVLTVEDEFITLETLAEYLNNSGYEVSGDAMNADEAIEVLEQGETDIAILDINIQGDRNGIWLADHIREHYNIPYIFLTAYGDQATVTRAMKTEPYGYLIKPFTEMDVFTAIEVALTNFAKGREGSRQDKAEEAPQIAIKDAIYLRQDHAYVKVQLTDITHISADRNYLDVYTSSDHFIVRSSLKDMIPVLPQNFMQVHRSNVVNLSSVQKFGPTFVEVNGQEIAVGKSYRDALFERFHKF